MVFVPQSRGKENGLYSGNKLKPVMATRRYDVYDSLPCNSCTLAAVIDTYILKPMYCPNYTHNAQERCTNVLESYGYPTGSHSASAYTTALPVAITARMILEGVFHVPACMPSSILFQSTMLIDFSSPCVHIK